MKICVFVFLTCFTAATQAATTATLDVTITGIKEQSGSLRVALFDSEDSFQKKPHKTLVIRPDSDTVSFSIDELATGTFAIMLFHDLDANEKLNTNLLGLPQEPWGGSLQGKSIFGPPKWKDTVFEHAEAGTQIKITLH